MKVVCIFAVCLVFAQGSAVNKETGQELEHPLKLDKRATDDEKLAVIADCIDKNDFDDTEAVELCLFERGANFLEPFVRETAERLLQEKYRAIVAEVNKYRNDLREIAEAPTAFSRRRFVQWNDA